MKYINQKQEYGFSEITIGSLTIYTAKVRFKGIVYEPGIPYLNVHHWNGYCYISFEVIDLALAQRLWQTIGTLGYNVAKAKLEQRYGWVINK